MAHNVISIVPGIVGFNPGHYMVAKPLAWQRNAHAISLHGRLFLAGGTRNELTAVTRARSWEFVYVEHEFVNCLRTSANISQMVG